MRKFKIVISYEFKIELKQVHDYIKYHFRNENAAKRLKKRVKEAINTLYDSPGVYPIIHELTDGEYRKIFVNNYLIIYKVDKEFRRGFNLTYIS